MGDLSALLLMVPRSFPNCSLSFRKFPKGLIVKAPKPKGLGLCFVAVSVSEETSYICSTGGPKQPLRMFIAAFMSLSWCEPHLYAGGNIYFFSMEGRVSVISAGREFKLLARNEFDGEFIASGAVAGNALILRSLIHLYCIEDGS